MSDTKQLIEQIKDILENLIHEIEDESLLDEIE